MFNKLRFSAMEELEGSRIGPKHLLGRWRKSKLIVFDAILGPEREREGKS